MPGCFLVSVFIVKRFLPQLVFQKRKYKRFPFLTQAPFFFKGAIVLSQLCTVGRAVKLHQNVKF